MEKDGLTTRLASSRQEMPVGQGALASCLQCLRATNWKTPQPVSTLTLGLVTSLKLQQQGNGIPQTLIMKALKQQSFTVA